MLELDLQRATDAAAPDDAAFRRWCELALRQRTADSEMTIRLVDEPEGRELNHTYRHKDYATNVLSFPADVPDDLLDIPCWATWSFACQWSSGKPPSKASRSKPTGRTVIHGCLHLLGYDHIEDDEAEEMEARNEPCWRNWVTRTLTPTTKSHNLTTEKDHE